MKIALVHDSLAQDGGAERVLRAMHRIWPEAPIFVLIHKKGAVEGFEQADIRESFLAKLPFGRTKYHWYLPLMPLATQHHDLSEFDIVISSSSTFAKGVNTGKQTLHISYCHTPARFLWIDSEAYIAGLRQNILVKTAVRSMVNWLRTKDQANESVDIFLSNSQTVQDRIRTHYARESTVLYPPVHIPPKKIIPTPTQPYFVAGGRLVRYKRFDIAIKAFNRLRTPLVIFGTGSEYKRLQRLARPHIQFVGRISDTEKIDLLRNAEAYIHPQIEDFGITAVEAMAVGRPVIAYRAGGALETVLEGKTGLFFDTQSWESLLEAVLRFKGIVWNKEKLIQHAETFAEDAFEAKLRTFVEEAYKHFRTRLSHEVDAGK